jgi:hypothetical protein
MPRNFKRVSALFKVKEMDVKFVELSESRDEAFERKKRVQALLSQMFLRLQKRGRPTSHRKDEELKNAA